MAPRPMRRGWYTDPSVPARVRFWDGTGWTRWLANRHRAPFPPVVDQAPVRPVEDRMDRLVRVLKWVLVGVLVAAVALTVTGMVLNRRDAARNPAGWSTADTPAPVVTVNPYEAVVVEGTKVSMLSGDVVFQVPAPGWDVSSPNEVEGMFDQAVFAAVPGPQDEGLPGTMIGVGPLSWVILPADRQASAEALAQLVALRLFGKLDQVRYTPAGSSDLTDFGDEHPGAKARIDVAWAGGSTVVEVRIVQARTGRWVGWIATDGPEVSDQHRTQREDAWKKTTVGTP
ncbi:DUF2510 domain-containing protein [Aestuariimicrobium ganziense]|uniref:DUF2510 domain-containing protein n=1 Tax=Aestuariimicrobium ganziense TaxID=2773677 RepID=UPI001943C504|nr:DUF2510 domain-containing protein [Aestuariimicrobium ganziense]